MAEKYGMLITTNDDGNRVFFVINIDHIFQDEEKARAEMNRLNAEHRKEHQK